MRRALVPALAAVLAGALWQATAEPTPPVVGQTPPSTTGDPIRDFLNNLFPTTTVPAPGAPGAPAPPGAPGPGAPAPGAPAPAPAPAIPAPPAIPPDVTAMINSVHRTGGRTTIPLMEALGRLRSLGFTEEEAAILGMGHFPVAGRASYSDDFYAFRAGPPVHAHQGTDVFANRGTPLRAPFDGVVRFSEGGLGGKMAYVTVPDGTYYFMAHLHSFAPGLGNGSRVKQGQIVGTVGDTGNAAGGAPHLHFEVHPGGGAAINPKPILDGWIDEAIANVPALVASFLPPEGSGGGGIPRALTDAGILRRFDPPRSPGATSELNSLLLAASVDPEEAAERMAELREAQADGRIEAEKVAAVEQALADAYAHARQLSRAVLAPVTPYPLEPVLVGSPD